MEQFNKEIVTRDEIQAYCGTLDKSLSVGLFWAPRVGKTKATLNLLAEGEKVLVVSNTEIIREAWKKVLPDGCKSICYQSLKNEIDEYDCIVFDESDLLGENYYEIVSNMTFKRFICLTGTETFRSKSILAKLKKKVSGEYFEWKIGFQQAIDWKILPEPQIICFGLNLRESKQDQVFTIGKNKAKQVKYCKYGEHFQHLREKKWNIAIQCSEKEWVSMINKEIDNLNEILTNFRNYYKAQKSGDQFELNRLEPIVKKYPLPEATYLNFIKAKGLARKNFLADKKNRYIKRLLKYFKVENERVLIFANSIPQAEFIDEKCAVHSNIKLKKGEISALDKFNSGDSSTLVAVGILDRGVSVFNVHTSFILQIPASQASVTQKASRNLLDDSPRLVLVYFKGTKDEENVIKFTKQFDQKYIFWKDANNEI